MPGLENRGGRLKSLLRAQLSLHTQATNLSRTDHRQKLTKWGKDHRYMEEVCYWEGLLSEVSLFNTVCPTYNVILLLSCLMS